MYDAEVAISTNLQTQTNNHSHDNHTRKLYQTSQTTTLKQMVPYFKYGVKSEISVNLKCLESVRIDMYVSFPFKDSLDTQRLIKKVCYKMHSFTCFQNLLCMVEWFCKLKN